MPTAADVNAANSGFQSVHAQHTRSGDVNLQAQTVESAGPQDTARASSGCEVTSFNDGSSSTAEIMLSQAPKGPSCEDDEAEAEADCSGGGGGDDGDEKVDLLDRTGEHLAIARGDVMSCALKIGLGRRKKFLQVADVKKLIRSIHQLKWTDEIAGTRGGVHTCVCNDETNERTHAHTRGTECGCFVVDASVKQSCPCGGTRRTGS